jgi:hypothetical protein
VMEIFLSQKMRVMLEYKRYLSAAFLEFNLWGQMMLCAKILGKRANFETKRINLAGYCMLNRIRKFY